jgi:hypothetical protein
MQRSPFLKPAQHRASDISLGPRLPARYTVSSGLIAQAGTSWNTEDRSASVDRDQCGTLLGRILCIGLFLLGMLPTILSGQPPGDGNTEVTAHPRGATAFHIEGEPRQAGPLYLQIDGQNIRIADAAFAAWLLDGGQKIAYSGTDGAGGYENEGQSLYLYDVRAETNRKVLSARFVIDQVTVLKTRQGRQALLVEMRDGGLGASHLAVIDPERGRVWLRQQAKLLSREGDRIVLGRYREQDWERMTGDTAVQPYQRERYDVNALLKRPTILPPSVVR